MGKRKIANKDIAKEVRVMGILARAVMPNFSRRSLVMAANAVKVLRGWGWRGMDVREVMIGREEGRKLRVVVYRPLKSEGEILPCVLWAHGGGYATGIPEQDSSTIRRFVDECRSVVVAPDYVLSPFKPFPAPVEDCWSALEWAWDNAEEIGVDRKSFSVAGDSAGGGIAAALSLMARDRGKVELRCQICVYPMLDDRPTSSNSDNDAPVWNTKSNEAAWNLYLDGRKGAEDISEYAAPARRKDLSGLPSAFTFIGSLDPFIEETREYFARLEAAGVETEMRVYDGCYHAFDRAAGASPQAKDAKDRMYSFYMRRSR